MHPYDKPPFGEGSSTWLTASIALVASIAALVLDVIRRDQNREEARKRRDQWRRRRAARRQN